MRHVKQHSHKVYFVRPLRPCSIPFQWGLTRSRSCVTRIVGVLRGRCTLAIQHDIFCKLTHAARCAVYESWQAAQLSSPLPTDEVDYIFYLMRTGVRELAERWSPILQSVNISLRTTAVFCHLTPKATFVDHSGSNATCELADLLIVHDHRVELKDGTDQTLRRAVLIQAKMANNGNPDKIDATQKYLYEYWPEFRLHGVGAKKQRYSNGLRNLGRIPNPGVYGLIERNPTSIFGQLLPWTIAEPHNTINGVGGEDAGAYITNMLYDTLRLRGRNASPSPASFLSNAAPNNHFDVTVDELLNITAAKTLNFKKPHIRGKRHEAMCFQHVEGETSWLPQTGASFHSSSEDWDGDGDHLFPKAEIDFDDRGISVLLLETGQRLYD